MRVWATTRISSLPLGKPEAMALLGKVSIPSLVIHGVDDPLVPQSAEAMSSA